MGILRPLARAFARLSFARRLATGVTREAALLRDREACRAVAPDARVRRGPFAGLRYPTLDAAGSALFPKLLGSYEDELHPLLDEWIARGFRHVVNVGCGEGYFAVGLALARPDCRVTAFDLDPRALALCAALAEANGVTDRVHDASPAEARALRTGFPADTDLVVCDCEGCEDGLFTPASLAALRRSSVLIEVHGDALGERIAREAAATHRVRWVSSHPKTLADYPEAAALPDALRHDSLLVERDTRQRWLVLDPLD